MPDSGGCYCCKGCLSLILTIGISALSMWLTLKADNPSCSINNFYLPALNSSLIPPANSTIFMDMRLNNGNKEKGIHYDQINITVRSFNHSNNSSWYGTIPGFYQGYQKKATKKVAIDTGGVHRSAMASRNQSAVFRVDLITQVRFKIMFWRTKRHKLDVQANVTVNEFGAKNTKRDIKLKSGVVNLGHHFRKVGIFLSLLGYMLLNI